MKKQLGIKSHSFINLPKLVPDELAHIFEEYDYDTLQLCISKVDFHPGAFSCNMKVKSIEYQNTLDEEWTVNVTGHMENRISFDYAAAFN